ncbi:MAG TPA: metalloregulator ArsR/SmtB family transcription factor [Candidatus Kapabacteria bacterium]|jgi:predicted transcriptional regulator|nr:metalloregulator ArsR/SmtB family transcription factor [Candidatus Kapabacteria bacterium]
MEDNIINNENIHNLAVKFKVLGEETRLKIIRCLESGCKSVNEIVETTGLLQANVSKHLKILEKYGIVKYQNNIHSHIYQIADPKILQICKIMCENDS